MTARKRKSPNGKKPAQKQPGFSSRAFAAAGRAAARHPRPLFGSASFVVVFGFVAANALWNQPGGHPAPFLATRDANDGIAGYRPARHADPDNVTTFRIERPGDPAETPAAPAVTPLTAKVQQQLIRRGFYDGTADGVLGSRTESAILLFQESIGVARTGEVTPQLLAALQAEPMATPAVDPSAAPTVPVSQPNPAIAARPAPAKLIETTHVPAPVPAARPRENLSADLEDPVAAAIRTAERNPVQGPRAEIPKAAIRNGGMDNVRAPTTMPSPELVLQIQRGLSNIAYADVTVDGVAGSQTRAAIRRFEKHYRLPETGEPNDMVLKKLKSIGAL